jgi:hypothetical protein
VLPAQQSAPGVPQVAHRPDEVEDVDVHTEPAAQRSVPLAPEQQAAPGSPHGVQVPLRHARPAWQELPQQAWPEAPQPAHFPAVQTPGPLPPLPPRPVLEPLPQVCDSATQISL